jgi:hypothetical protein
MARLVEVVALEKAGNSMFGGVQVIAQQEFREGSTNVDSITFVCPADEAPKVGDLLQVTIQPHRKGSDE